MNPIAYQIIADDIGCEIHFNSETFCKCCERMIACDYKDPFIVGTKPKLEIGFTYNGYLIVSKEIKNFLLEKLPDKDFIAHTIINAEGFFLLECKKVKEIDLIKNFYYDSNFCKLCRMVTSRSLQGLFLKDEEASQEGLFISNVCFGGGRYFREILMIGIKTGDLLKKSFNGVSYIEILKKKDVEKMNAMSLEELGNIIVAHNHPS